MAWKFAVVVGSPLPDISSAKLGASTSTKLVEADKGKPVKLSSADNYIVCSAGDEIEGFVNSVEPFTQDGFSFGGVQTNKRVIAVLDAAQVGTVAVRSLVVAGASAALGSADAYPKVKTGTPADFKWRVISILTGTGVAGDRVLIEKI